MAYDDTMKEGGNAMDLAVTDVENIIDNESPDEAIEMMMSQMKAEKDPNAKKAYQDGIDRVKRGLTTEHSDVSTIMNEGVEQEMAMVMIDQMDIHPNDFYFDDQVLYVEPRSYPEVMDELGDYAEKRFYKIKKMSAPDLESLQYNEAVGVGDMVKVKDQEIIGRVVSDFGNKIVIRDEDAETDDDELEFKKSDVELYPYPELDEADHKDDEKVGDVSFKDKDPLPGKFQGFGISQSPQYRAKAKKILDKMGIKYFNSGTKGLMIYSKPEDQDMIMRAIKSELGTPSYTVPFYEGIEKVIEAYGASNPKYDEKSVERELQKAGIAPRSRQAKAVHALLKGKQQDESGHTVQSPYAIGMAKAMKMYKDKPPLSKRTIKKAHSIAKGVMGEAAKPLKVKALSDNAKEMLKKALKSKAGRSRFTYGDTIELMVNNPEDVPDQLMQAIHDELEQEAIQGGMLKSKDVGKYPDRIDNIKISAKAAEHPELPGAFFPKVNITGEYMKEEKTNTTEAGHEGPHMAGKSSWTHSAKGGKVTSGAGGKELTVNSIVTRRYRDDTNVISGEIELEMMGSPIESVDVTDNPNLHKEVMDIIKKSSDVGMSPVIKSSSDVSVKPDGNIVLGDIDIDSLNKYMEKAKSPIIPYQALVKKYPGLKGHFMTLPGGKEAVGHMDVDKFMKDSKEIKEGPTSDRAAEIVADIANSQEGGYFETEEALEQFLSDNLPSFSDKDYDHMKAVEKAVNMVDDHVKGYAYEDNTVKFNEEIQRMKYLAGQSKVLENEHRGYANSPKEQVIDSDTKLNKMSGGANKPKKTYPKVAGGDNPMQKVEEDTSALEKALQEEFEILKKED